MVCFLDGTFGPLACVVLVSVVVCVVVAVCGDVVFVIIVVLGVFLSCSSLGKRVFLLALSVLLSLTFAKRGVGGTRRQAVWLVLRK